MASLKGTTVTSLTVGTSISTTTAICNSTFSTQQWVGEGVGLGVGATLNLIGNSGGYHWIMGHFDISAHQSYNSTHQFWFALSRYGIKTATSATWDGAMSLSYYQDPGNPDLNYLRITNTYSYAAAYYVTGLIFAGKSSSYVTSSVLTRIM